MYVCLSVPLSHQNLVSTMVLQPVGDADTKLGRCVAATKMQVALRPLEVRHCGWPDPITDSFVVQLLFMMVFAIVVAGPGVQNYLS